MNEAEAYQAFDQPPEAPVAFLAWAVATSGLGGPIRVMDLGCGPGRLLVPMHELGWAVTGLEPNLAYYRAAQDASSSRPGIKVRRGGFLALEDNEAFEVIACINDTFQYLLTPAERRTALQRMLRALVPGGLVVLDLANFFYILRNYRAPQPMTIQFREGHLTRTILHTVDFHHARWVHTDKFCYLNGAGSCTELVTTHTLAMVSFPEVAYALEETGFVDVRAYPSLASRSQGRAEGARMVVTARKRQPPNNRLKQAAVAGQAESGAGQNAALAAAYPARWADLYGSNETPMEVGLMNRLGYLGFLGFLGSLGFLGFIPGHRDLFSLFALFGLCALFALFGVPEKNEQKRTSDRSAV